MSAPSPNLETSLASQEIVFQREPQWKMMLRRFTSNKLAVFGGIIVLLLVLTAIFAPFIAPYDPVYSQDYQNVLQPPERIYSG